MKRLFILFTLVIVAASAGLYFRYTYLKPTAQDGVTKEAVFLKLILDANPVFSYENKPLIKIINVTEYDEKWYVVSIASLNTTQTAVPVRFIIVDSDEKGEAPRIILGPEAYLPESLLLQYNVPDSVILGLREP